MAEKTSSSHRYLRVVRRMSEGRDKATFMILADRHTSCVPSPLFRSEWFKDFEDHEGWVLEGGPAYERILQAGPQDFRSTLAAAAAL